MSDTAIPGPDWVPAFLEKLAQTRKVADAICAAGVQPGTVYYQRRRNRRFADAWQAALAGEAFAAPDATTTAPAPPPSNNGGWQKPFLELLAETSNIGTSAKRANVPLSTVYAMRRRDNDFAAKWDRALTEGYTNLEMEVLGYLRDPAPGYKMDVANALRLLAAHKETAARERARRSKQDKAAVLASLNAKIDKMRERKAAAARLLAEEEIQQVSGDDGT